MSPRYGELRPTSGWDRSSSLGHPCKFQRVSRLDSITARHLVVGVSQTLRVEKRAPPMFGRAAITLGIGPHSSYYCSCCCCCCNVLKIYVRFPRQCTVDVGKCRLRCGRYPGGRSGRRVGGARRRLDGQLRARDSRRTAWLPADTRRVDVECAQSRLALVRRRRRLRQQKTLYRRQSRQVQNQMADRITTSFVKMRRSAARQEIWGLQGKDKEN